MAGTAFKIVNLEKMTIELQPDQSRDGGPQTRMSVMYTGSEMQVAIVSVPPNGTIPYETHEGEQFIRIEAGEGRINIGMDDFHDLKSGDAIVIAAGVQHKVVASKSGLRFYTVYAPPAH